jgi:hypothetical protein
LIPRAVELGSGVKAGRKGTKKRTKWVMKKGKTKKQMDGQKKSVL